MEVEFYCYNVMALSVLFWYAFAQCLRGNSLTQVRSVALFCGSWSIRSDLLGRQHGRVALISKMLAVFFPSIIVGLSHAPGVIHLTKLFFIVTNITSKSAFYYDLQVLRICSAWKFDYRERSPHSNIV